LYFAKSTGQFSDQRFAPLGALRAPQPVERAVDDFPCPTLIPNRVDQQVRRRGRTVRAVWPDGIPFSVVGYALQVTTALATTPRSAIVL
jgi:hypothetical protein